MVEEQDKEYPFHLAMQIPIKTLIRSNYFFFGFAVGSWSPFLAPFFQDAYHLNDRELGLLLMVRPAVALLTQPFWSAVTDLSGRRAWLVLLLSILAGAGFPLIIKAGTFAMLLFLFGLWAFFYSPINAILDAIAFDYLGKHRRLRFARLRVFASIGFLIAVAFIGKVYDRVGMESMFPVYAVTMLISAVFMMRIPGNSRTPLLTGWNALKQLLRNKNVLIFLSAVLLLEIGNQMAHTFISVYAKALGADNLQTGWIWAAGTGSEIVTMLLFQRFASRVGIKKLIFIGILSSVVRWTALSFLGDWWQILPFQLLHAFSFTFVYVGASTFMDMESHANIRFTAQAFYSIIVLNLACIIGSVAGGEISHQWSYHTLYFGSAVLAVVALVILSAFVKQPHPDK